MRELRTERLYLRFLRREDVPAIFENWARDPAVTRFLTWNPHESPETTGRVMDKWLPDYEKPDTYRYGIELVADGELIGMIDVVGYHHGNPVIGYCSGRRWWGNGYMTEALHAVTEMLFSEGFDTIVIEAASDNIGSNRVIQKNGFTLVQVYEAPLSDGKPEIITKNSYRLYRRRS